MGHPAGTLRIGQAVDQAQAGGPFVGTEGCRHAILFYDDLLTAVHGCTLLGKTSAARLSVARVGAKVGDML